MKNCTFCKIINGDLPSKIVCENKNVIAIMAIEQEVPGHILIIPKTHYSVIEEANTVILTDLMLLIKDLGNHIKSIGYDGYNLLSANGEAAGQSISHFHFHFIPRKKNDGIDAWPKLQYSGKIEEKNIFKELKF